MSWLLDGRPLDSLLVTRLRYLGDVVMSTVVLTALRRGDPGLRLGYLCEAAHAAVLAGHPDLTAIHRLRSGRRGADAAARAAGSPAAAAFGEATAGTLGTVRALRRERYAAAVDLFFNPRSAWLLRLAGIPQRLGGSDAWRRRLYTHTTVRRELAAAGGLPVGLPGGGLSDHLCRLAPLVHAESGRPFLDWVVGEFAPGELRPRLAPPPAAGGHPPALAALGLAPDRGTLVLAPAATWPSKEWPRRHWLELIEAVAEHCDLAPVVLAAPGRRPEFTALGTAAAAHGGGLLPELPLPEVLRIVAGARALVGVDGGILHASVGLGVPTLGLFGPTDPAAWFPYEGSGPFRVLATRPACHPCHLHRCDAFVCLPDLSARATALALDEVLAAAESAP